jgi:HTH-type transcriptional regulator / antitoxin HigA
METGPIRTDKDHRAALAEIEACWGAPEGAVQGDRLDVLVALVEIYEARRWPVEMGKSFDPIDVLNYAIEELGHSRAELTELLGSRSRALEILSRRRAHCRHDPQDYRRLENPRRASCPALQDRTGLLTTTGSPV